jgi:hypothetical protein
LNRKDKNIANGQKVASEHLLGSFPNSPKPFMGKDSSHFDKKIKKRIWQIQQSHPTFASVLSTTTYQERQREMAR